VLLLTGCASFRGGAVPQDAARYIERDSSVKSAIVYQSNVAKTFADDWFISARPCGSVRTTSGS
jgi:hypothetical protein